MLLGTLIIVSLILGYCGLYIDVSIWEDVFLFTYLGWSIPYIVLIYKNYVRTGNLIKELNALKESRFLYNRTEVEEEAYVKLAAALVRNKYNDEFLSCLFCAYNIVGEEEEVYDIICKLMPLTSKETFDNMPVEEKEAYAKRLLLYETTEELI